MKEQIETLLKAAAWEHHEACEESNYRKEKLWECIYNCLLETKNALKDLEKLSE